MIFTPSHGPCYDPAYGQAEDYGVIIKDLPQLITTVVSNIGSDAAQSGGNITSQGGSSVSVRGIVWGLYNNPTLDNNWGFSEDGIGTGSFVSQMNDLKPNQNYYVRAYAINDGGIAYGQNETFTSLSEVPVMVTDDITNISYFSATSGGNITDDGGQAIQSRGIVWDTVSMPTFSRNVGKTDEGTGAGTFSSDLTGLFTDKTYYVRAYGRNSYSIAYGAEKVFTTLPPDADQARDIHFDNVTTNKMDVLWTNGTGSKRIVKINTSSTFTPPVNGNDPTANPVYGGGEQVIYNGTGSMVTITNLDPSTIYYFFVYDYTGSGTATVYNSAPGYDNPNYCSTFCLPEYTSGDVGTHFKRFILNTIDNSSGSSHYSDYSSISTALLPGSTYDVSFEMSYNQERVSLWIDLNDNHEFEDSEKLLSDLSCPANEITTSHISLPSVSNYGNRSLRIRASWGTWAGPCSTETYGEVEDYTVDIRDGITWTGTSSTDWNDNSDWDVGKTPLVGNNVTIPSSPAGGNYPETNTGTGAVCNNLTIEAGAHLHIPYGKTLTVNGVLSNFAGTNGLVLKTNDTGISSLLHNTNNVDATVESYITENKWHIVSAPISDAKSNVFTDLYLMYFDETDYSWHYITNLNHDLTEGRGFMAWSTSGTTGNATVDYTGILNNGDVAVNGLSYTPSQPLLDRGWNMVGNPYPSAIHWSIAWGRTNLDATIYVYDAGTSGNYLTYNTTGIGTHPTGDVAPGQGFWVKANNSGASLAIPQSERKHSNQAFYKSGNEIGNMITLTAVGNEYSDKTIIYFNEDASPNFDNDYDAWKIKGLSEAPQIYSFNQSEELAVNTLPFDNQNMIIPLGFEVGVENIYTISILDLENLEESIEVYLEDQKENNITDLRKQSSYTFAAYPNEDPKRFFLHFNYSASSMEENALIDHNIYSNGKNIFVRVSEFTMGDIMVYNMMGHEMAHKNFSGNELVQITLQAKPGFYLVKVQTERGVITEKVFIK
ncbi:MAG: GEVED domain-containing protein [Bacteroidales bacterium]